MFIVYYCFLTKITVFVFYVNEFTFKNIKIKCKILDFIRMHLLCSTEKKINTILFVDSNMHLFIFKFFFETLNFLLSLNLNSNQDIFNLQFVQLHLIKFYYNFYWMWLVLWSVYCLIKAILGLSLSCHE